MSKGKGGYIPITSHELRTPLTGIKTLSAIFQKITDTKRREPLAKATLEKVNKLGLLINRERTHGTKNENGARTRKTGTGRKYGYENGARRRTGNDRVKFSSSVGIRLNRPLPGHGKVLVGNGLEMFHDLWKTVIGSLHAVTAAVMQFGCYGWASFFTEAFRYVADVLRKPKAFM